MKESLKGLGFGLLILAGIAATGVALDLGTKWYKAETAVFSGKSAAEVQIESAPSRIANYNSFYDQCAAIQGYEGAIKAQEANIILGMPADERARTLTVITGIKAQRSRAIAQYNVDARKQYTAARFKASDLPFQLDDSGSKTSCQD